MAMAWYVVHTYSGYENKAKLALEDAIRRYALESKFGEILVPTEKVVEVKDGKKKTNTRKVFPGYIFVQMMIDNETWHVVKTTPKITGFIGGSRNPPPITEEEIKRIIGEPESEDAGTEAPKVEINFARGDEVNIIDGPFASMKGRVEEVNEARGKLRVMVSIFGRPTAVELEFTQVERLS
ncbi:MAG: transcription termination/antitermination protein NusG [Myxococcota bacterium]